MPKQHHGTEPRPPRLFICDPNLRSQHGHYLGYATRLAEAAAALGVDPFILAALHVSVPGKSFCPILPTFSRRYWEELRGPSGSDTHIHLTRSADQFGEELLRCLRSHDAGDGDTIFLPYANLVEVLGTARALRGLSPQSMPRIVPLFRRPAAEQARDALLTGQAHRAMLTHALADLYAVAGAAVRPLTDSNELADEHSELTGRRFQAAPIPVDPLFGAQPFGEAPLPLTIGYLGDARQEKGYCSLPALAESLKQELADGSVQMLLQSNFNMPGGEIGIREAFDRLREYPNVVLLLEPPDRDEYARVMRAIHLLVLPYEADRYRTRTSGILAEAIHAGVPAIVPRGTWLADQLRQHGAGLAYSPDEPGAFPAAVRHALDTLAELRDRARNRRDAFVQVHNPERLARFVLGVDAIARASRVRRRDHPVLAACPPPTRTAPVESSRPRWTLVCQRDAAESSADSRVPHGTRHDNNVNPLFALHLERLFGRDTLSLLDLGCSGGGFVRMCIERGYDAVGLEGSPFSRRTARAEWPTIPDRLFTCDITGSFELTREAPGSPGTIGQFDVITAWEVIEHITADDLPTLCANVTRHLAPGGVWILSVSDAPDSSAAAPGVDWHRCVHPRDWWTGTLLANGFTNNPALIEYFGSDWVRGPLQNAPASFHLVLSRSDSVPAPIPVRREFDAETLLRVGVDFLRRGTTTASGILPYALNLFDRTLVVTDAPAQVQFLRAATLLHLGRVSEAASAAGACLAVNPQHEGARAIRAAIACPQTLDEGALAVKAG